MANLHVQPKRRNNSWIWILVIILIITAAIYYYFNYYKKGITPGADNAIRDTSSLQVNLSQIPLEETGVQTLLYTKC